MIRAFLSYATKDHFFAELAVSVLKKDDIELWRDAGQIRAGENWRTSIDEAISKSEVVIVALSKDSTVSSYVTYEWAYAIGKGKPVIPVKLENCDIHPRLQIIQFLDFSVPGSLPWESLIERVKEIEIDNDVVENRAEEIKPIEDETVNAILAYLNQRGYQMASFDRLRRRIDENLTDDGFKKIIDDNPLVFRKARIKGGRPGLAKKIP